MMLMFMKCSANVEAKHLGCYSGSGTALGVAVMAAIPVVMVEVGSELTLAIPPPIATEEERRETGLPVVTPLVFSFHICTAFHEHEHHASLCELIAHET